MLYFPFKYLYLVLQQLTAISCSSAVKNDLVWYNFGGVYLVINYYLHDAIDEANIYNNVDGYIFILNARKKCYVQTSGVYVLSFPGIFLSYIRLSNSDIEDDFFSIVDEVQTDCCVATE